MTENFPDDRIGRFFIVGCPRSGTTLLQSFLAAHPEIASFPESHFFPYLYRFSRLSFGKIGLASSKARVRLVKFLEDIEESEKAALIPPYSLFGWEYARIFIKTLDCVAEQRGKKMWVEKTPQNISCISRIRAFAEGCKFIHIIRDGKDVVASMYETTRDHPAAWGGAKPLEDCVKRWIRDACISRRYVSQRSHIFVKYEYLVNDTPAVLKGLCSFMGIDFNEDMMKERESRTGNITREGEVWKKVAHGDVNKTPAGKFDLVFNADQKKYVLDRVSRVDLSRIPFLK